MTGEGRGEHANGVASPEGAYVKMVSAIVQAGDNDLRRMQTKIACARMLVILGKHREATIQLDGGESVQQQSTST